MTTHFSDGLAVGTTGYPPQPANPGSLGRSSSFATAGPGLPISPVYVYRLVPAAASATNLNGGTTTYTGTAVSIALTAGAGVTSTTILGGVSVLDIVGALGERSVQVTAAGGNTAAAVTINGYDMYEVPISVTFSSPTSGASATLSPKTFRYVTSASFTGNTTSSISLGVADRIGFPVRVNNPSDVLLTWSGGVVTNNVTGFVAADTTLPVTNGTTNVRGSYTLQSASNGSAVFTAWIFPIDVNTTSGAFGVSQV